jgi:hypothetical protein
MNWDKKYVVAPLPEEAKTDGSDLGEHADSVLSEHTPVNTVRTKTAIGGNSTVNGSRRSIEQDLTS